MKIWSFIFLLWALSVFSGMTFTWTIRVVYSNSFGQLCTPLGRFRYALLYTFSANFRGASSTVLSIIQQVEYLKDTCCITTGSACRGYDTFPSLSYVLKTCYKPLLLLVNIGFITGSLEWFCMTANAYLNGQYRNLLLGYQIKSNNKKN